MNKETRILFSPDELKKDICNKHIDFCLTNDEMKNFPNLESLSDVEFTLSCKEVTNGYILTLKEHGAIKLIDGHTLDIVDYLLDDFVDIQISENEDSDIQVEEDGCYDLRGCIIALLFNSIPQNYSKVPLKKIVKEEYTLMSEEEYEKEKQRKNNPFSKL